MLNSIRKDHNRRILVKRFEIDRLQNKTLSRAVFLLNSPFFQDKNNRLNENTDINEKYDLSSNTTSLCYKRISKSKEDVNNPWKEQILRSTPRNSSRVRIRNRCIESGRPRAVLKFCKLSRIRLRLKASQGLIPGLRKSSW